MAMVGDTSLWCCKDGAMLAFRFGGDPGVFLSRSFGHLPTPVLTGLAGKAGAVGDSRLVQMQEFEIPVSDSIGCGRL